jgi:hypothetical protein
MAVRDSTAADAGAAAAGIALPQPVAAASPQRRTALIPMLLGIELAWLALLACVVHALL